MVSGRRFLISLPAGAEFCACLRVLSDSCLFLGCILSTFGPVEGRCAFGNVRNVPPESVQLIWEHLE